MTTDDLTHALAFAASPTHTGDITVLFSQAKAAARTLAGRVADLERRLAMARDGLRLCIAGRCGVVWITIPDPEVDAYINSAAALAATKNNNENTHD